MRKKVFAIIILLIMLASIPVGVYLVKRRQELQLRAAPATVLSLTPATGEYDVGETFIINVSVNTGENLIVGADIALNYDPLILEGLSTTMGSFLQNAIELHNNINKDTGRITYSLYTPRENAKQGEGILASISFKGKVAGTSSVVFDETQCAIGGIGEEDVNLLVDTVPGSYTIAAATPTSTPTPTPTTSPTATPTPTPGSGTPTESPTPTPTGGVGGPEATATPTPTTAPGTTPTSTPTPTPTVSPEELPEAGVLTSTLLFLLSGGIILTLGFLALLL